MLKRCLLAVIIALLVTITGSQIASAEDYDWSKAKRISTKAEFVRYIESERKKGNNIFHVILTNGLRLDDKWEFSKLAPSNYDDCSEPKIISTDGTNTKMIYKLREYPGTKVANAYLSKYGADIAWRNFTAAERELYNRALYIVNNANKLSNPIAKERYIHDEICCRADFYSEGDMRNQPRYITAIGALVDGKANCQGFSDAFYMLGRMCGLNVGRISGKNGDIQHQWNTITFDDGKTYCVDVSYADKITVFGEKRKIFTYTHFNAPLEIMNLTHSAQWDVMAPNLQRKIDNRYAFRSLYGLAQANTVQEGLNLVANKLSKENYKIFRVMVPAEKNFSQWTDFNNYLKKIYSKEVELNTIPLGNYFFLTVIKK